MRTRRTPGKAASSTAAYQRLTSDSHTRVGRPILWRCVHLLSINKLTNITPHTAGFVNVRLEEEKPIFNKQRIDFTPPEKINHLAVCNNQLCMSLGKDTILRQTHVVLRSPLSSLIGCCVAQTNVCVVCVIYRIDLAKPDQPNQIELGRKDESKVHKLFLDPTGEKIFYVYSTFLELSHINRYKKHFIHDNYRCGITAEWK